MYNAFDRLLISSTQWNYTVSNRNDSMIGDGWNQEDLSIWSIDQSLADDPNSGGRAIEGFCRPYIRSAQGTIISQRFDRRTGLFLAEIQIDTRIDAPTEIYAPQVQYRSGCHCEVSQGDAEWRGQLLHVHAAIDGILSVRLERR
jgi:hypothetical protein